MKPWLLLAWLGAATSVAADEPAQADKSAACLILDNRILGPRSAGRPLPLYTRDPSGGFHPACTVPWSTLSPKNEALPVVGCFSGSLLQVANDTACGRSTGPLWVSTRWVVTSGDVQHPLKPVATCQQLETGAYAGSRDYKPSCEERQKEHPPGSVPQPRAFAETPSREGPPVPAPPPQALPTETAPPETPAATTVHPRG
jgi:hypothetical protein